MKKVDLMMALDEKLRDHQSLKNLSSRDLKYFLTIHPTVVKIFNSKPKIVASSVGFAICEL